VGEIEPPAGQPSAVTVFVFAPTPLLTVTVEAGPEGVDEIHLHAGGQGFWIGRMAANLGAEVCLCAPCGDEVGDVLVALMQAEGVRVQRTLLAGANGAYVQDRRDGSRMMIAQMPPTVLRRHEVDELYTASLTQGLRADVAVLGGSHADDVLSADVYARLAADLSAHGVPVVADLSGDQLKAALEGGVTVLKVSHEDLIDDGWARRDDSATLMAAMHELAQGATCVVVSRAADPALALFDDRVVEVVAPSLHQVDHRGAGDSMTAGIAVALAQGQTFEQALRVGAAAGALNVTRRGLATGQAEAVAELVERVVVREPT